VQGLKKWTKIANTIKSDLGIEGKTGKQCRERWHNHLDPQVKKELWTPEEEAKIFELQKQFGNKWSEIASFVPGRTENSVKNCFYSAVRRNLRKFNRKRNESEKIKGSIKNLLKKPHVKELLMGEVEDIQVGKKGKERKIKGKKKGGDRKEMGLVGKVQPVSIVQMPKRSTRNKPNDIICPTISPIPSLSYFSFPITPSTSQSILSSKFNQNYFSFGETVEPFESSNNPKPEVDLHTDLSFTECSTPHYFIPHFSPKSSFQHYITPRNSTSK
jgi:hypothetical protein